MLRHQYVDLFRDLFEVRDAKWKKRKKYERFCSILVSSSIVDTFSLRYSEIEGKGHHAHTKRRSSNAKNNRYTRKKEKNNT